MCSKSLTQKYSASRKACGKNYLFTENMILLALAECFTQGQKIALEVIQGKNLDEQSNMKKKRQKESAKGHTEDYRYRERPWVRLRLKTSVIKTELNHLYLLKKIYLLIYKAKIPNAHSRLIVILLISKCIFFQKVTSKQSLEFKLVYCN